jgi:uncharacterized protein YfaS (alpha-2-macroglobulin family)
VSASVLVALLLGAPTVAQEEESRAFFSLSSSRSWAPGETPAVQLWADGVDTLQFRVYRINDPVAFFSRLEDPHRFGGRARARPTELTPIERFHQWKRRMQAQMRDLVRRQYSAETRAAIRLWLALREQKPVPPDAPAAVRYAEVPLLNPQQVVAVWEQRTGAKRRWSSQVVPVKVDRKGLYLVEATDGKLTAYTIVSVTDLVMLTKGAPGRILARVVDRAGGAPVGGCRVVARVDGKEGARAETDAQGFVEIRLEKTQPEQVTLMAHRGEDFAVNALYGWALGSDPDRRLTGYVYTDRPVYRPGHQVRFRAIARRESERGYELPGADPLRAEVRGPDGSVVHRATLALSRFGTVHGEFTLPEAAALGYYAIELMAQEARLFGGFHVEEYRKPEYAVSVKPRERRYLQGRPIEAEIEARYYYGEPVAHAKVTYVIHRSRYWPPGEEEEDFEGEGWGYGEQEQVLEQEGELDAEGRLTIQFEAAPADSDMNYRIEARVTDAARREVSGSAWVLATVADYRLEIAPTKYIFEPRETARFEVAALDYEGGPVAGVAFRVELAEHRWREGGGPVLATAEGRTDPLGKATVEFVLPDSAALVARVSSQTPEGRTVRDTTYIWLGGGGGYPVEQRLQIVPDKKSYRPGEVARVLILTGAPEAHLWVTVEGRTVSSSQFITARGPSASIEIPVLAEYAPNFFVTAACVRQGQLYLGTRSIRAPALEQTLAVELRSSKDIFKPGETGQFTLEAKDYQGRPVAAEFSLGVVDEAIYAVRNETVPELSQFFYGRIYNRVHTDSSLSYYFSGEAGRRRMELAARRRGRPLAQLKPERFVMPKVRKAFPDTIYWIADLRTDASGRAQVRVSFPDALTTWRATARGVTEDTKVGSARHKTQVRKNLVLRLTAPRFFTEGDEMTISAIVHNYLASDKTVRVSLETQGLEILEGGTRDIAVASRGEAKVDYRVRAQGVRKAVLLGKALTDEESDALELEMPVVPFGVKLAESRTGMIEKAGEAVELDVAYPAASAPQSRSIEIQLAPSLAGTILGALEYLTSYPYGCTEQTMSSFLPNVLVAQAARELRIETDLDARELARKVAAGLERLYDFQHPDGGWGWWAADESDAFMTAYVLAGLKQAQEAGYRVRPEVLERGVAWLRSAFENLPAREPDLAAYALYALALNDAAEQAEIESVFRRQEALSPYGLALLGLALEARKDGRAGTVAARLEPLARRDSGIAYWEAERDPLLGLRMSTSPEATAHAMKLLARLRPQSPLLEPAARWLIRNRDQGYYWSSTKQTAMVLYGLIDYLKASGELEPDLGVEAELNGKVILRKKITRAEIFSAPVAVRLDAAQLAEANRLRLTTSGKGRLYWALRSEYYTRQDSLSRVPSGKLGIRREYFKLAPEARGGRIVHRLEPRVKQAAAGEVLAVRLTLDGGDWQYLLVEDPIPAGTEPVERADLYELDEQPSWWSFWVERRELRDDRATFYLRNFSRGAAELVYLLRVTNPGLFRVSPTRVSPMYEPETLATSAALTLEVR